ncbi:hypothetical protein [Catenulispora subtropica]|uniref:hypothetical protein n=1 Tax=Catenulispora subtropica TaxID=450798 RepID=UPI0031DC6BC2
MDGQVCAALETAHRVVVHRDIKPASGGGAVFIALAEVLQHVAGVCALGSQLFE